MLVLSRKVGEEVCAPDVGIVVKILEVCGGHIRLGVTAPAGVRLFRGELWARIQERASTLEEEGPSSPMSLRA